MVADSASDRRVRPVLLQSKCGSSVDGLGPRRGADLEPQRKVGFIRQSKGGSRDRTLQRCVEQRTHSAAKRLKNKWRGSESRPTEEEVFDFMSVIRNVFKPDYDHYEGVYKINIYLLRLLYVLMLLFLGKDSWTHVLTFKGSWDPEEAAAWCVWASYSALSVLGIIHPLKMLPLVLLEISYKVLWLIIVAYPLWSTNQLIGSPVQEMTYEFLWVALAIAAMPLKYAFKNYILKPKEPK